MSRLESSAVVPWATFHVRWARRGPPQQPDASVRAALCTEIAGYTDRVVLLGVTPELSGIASRTVAVDWSASSVAYIWPGDGATRRAIRANWLSMPIGRSSMSAAIGDGSFNCLEYPREYRRVFGELTRVVRPGGLVAVRIYLTPDGVESVEAACAHLTAGRPGTIHGLKWRIANAIAGHQGNPNVPARSIHAVFNSRIPDRQALQQATGWTREDIAQIDAYADLPDAFSFPTVAQIRSVACEYFDDVRLVASGAYELAERCPILVMEVPR
jgi:hypothetical protein